MITWINVDTLYVGYTLMAVPTKVSWHAIPKSMMEKGVIALTQWIKKMENSINNNRFHELAMLVLHLVTPESSRIKRYIAGLAPEI
uniref:Reverse transcriptase domain-containing protein n=1 Tax=Tanacetum cinerariifolium TaxID=118510 RepID=A0A699RQ03_TANCI|nr:reverse transcriptase domain-containing protein [Tanacetum cinerariifolium]